MFAKNQRITKDKDFNNVFKNGISSYDKVLGVKAVKNNLKINRFGILVSVKVSKKAVDRNLLKRQIREILKTISFSDDSCYDVVVIILPSSSEKNFLELKKSLDYNFKKLKLIK